MRFRLGMIVGFGAGYYLGAAAGRERYEQINRKLRQLRRSETVETAEEKARALVDLGVERAREAVEERRGEHGEGTPGTTFTRDQPLASSP